MKTNVIFKLAIFILLLAGHMYIYDPSIMKFCNSIKEVLNIKLNDKFLLHSVVWIVGFWGMLLMLNNKSAKVRMFSWVLFILTSFTEFAYMQTLGKSFALGNVDQFGNVMSKLVTINTVALLKFVAISAILLIAAFVMKSLSLDMTRTFAFVLIVSIASTLFLYKGVGLVLPTFYLIPALAIYKYIMVLYGMVFTTTGAK